MAVCKILHLNTLPFIEYPKLKKVFHETFLKTQNNLEEISKLSKEEFYFLLDMQKRTLGIKYGGYRGSQIANKKVVLTNEKIGNFECEYSLLKALDIIERLENLDFIRGYFVSSISSRKRFSERGFILNPVFFAHGNVTITRGEKSQTAFNERRSECLKEYFTLSRMSFSERFPYELQFKEDDYAREEQEAINKDLYPDEYIYIRNTLPTSVREWHKKVLPDLLNILNFMKDNSLHFKTTTEKDFFIFLAVNMYHGSNTGEEETREIFRKIKSFFKKEEVLFQTKQLRKCYSYSKKSLQEHFSQLYKKHPELVEKTTHIVQHK